MISKKRKLWLGFAAPVLVVALTVGLQATRQGPSGSALGESPFDGGRAFQDLETVVGFGARPSGSTNLERTRTYILAELESAGLEPEVDAFVANTPIGEIEMANVRAVRRGTSGKGSIAVSGHFDTKRFDFNFLGASDGGSSTAVILELARVTGDLALEHDLEFIFFDGEEAVLDWTATDSVYGSRYDVRRRIEDGALGDLKALVLVDMVGDRDLTLLQEGASTDWLKSLIWNTAQRLGYGDHFGSRTAYIEDDHVPYLNAGIPAIDLIDFDYPYWHTPGDTLDKTSSDSLQVIGDVVYHSLGEIDRRLSEESR
jgi:glutaminyl-peptide cyclotransferase